jgi:hypothetical protein
MNMRNVISAIFIVTTFCSSTILASDIGNKNRIKQKGGMYLRFKNASRQTNEKVGKFVNNLALISVTSVIGAGVGGAGGLAYGIYRDRMLGLLYIIPIGAIIGSGI